MGEIEELSKILDKTKVTSDDFYKKGTRMSKLNAGYAADKSDHSTTEQVLDGRTRMIIFRMLNKGIFDDLKGCISTGKEANVYRAVLDSGEQKAVKVYKTAILAFKDRDRYVAGEYRFRFGYSKHNHRLMVKLWAEKETRNLKRIYRAGIPTPKPLNLVSHVLVMEFLGDKDGYASPKLKDADIDLEQYPALYWQLVAYMRIMYKQCRLVHADLSEYNIIYHEDKLWIIDVSQSVEHDHPSSLDFLRMDIKNVNDYFERQGVNTFSEIQMFKFITGDDVLPANEPETVDNLTDVLSHLTPEEKTEESAKADAVFRSIYIPRNLNEVFDVDRDTERVREGEEDSLIYKDMLKLPSSKTESGSDASEESDEGDSEEDSSSDSESEDENAVSDVWDERWQPERKFADREANKERKKQFKEAKREKRANKMKKKDKKRLVAASKSRGKAKK